MGDIATTDTTDTTRTAEQLDALLMDVFITPEGKQDPYPTYEAVREAVDVHATALGFHVTARYDLCQQALRDNRFGKFDGELDTMAAFGITKDEFEARFPRRRDMTESMLGLNPPDHTRLRGLVAKAFTPSVVKNLEPHIADLADDLLQALDGEVDLMSALAFKLPVTVISEMLGVPRHIGDELLPDIRVAVQGLATFDQDLDRFTRIYEAQAAIGTAFDDLIAAKRAEPGDDLLSALIHVEEAGDQLTPAELLSTVILIYVAGFETTTNLIGNGTRALLLHPDQLRQLRDDRLLLKSAIEEMLRWDSPVQLTGRTVIADDGADVGDLHLDKGQEVLTLLGGANRDPRVYDDPDRFDITRPGPAPLSFSAGIHYCLGAALARAEGHIVFDRLLDTFPAIEPAWSELTYRDNLVLRGLETLPVTLSR